jgi:hypothetical protein
LAAVYGTRKQADAKSRELGEAYKVVYGEQRIGSDEFIVHEGPPRRRGRSFASRSPSRWAGRAWRAAGAARLFASWGLSLAVCDTVPIRRRARASWTMAGIIELNAWENPRALEIHAMVIASPVPPVQGTSFKDHRFGRWFYATRCEHDIAVMVRRAIVWADARRLANIYVRRQES